MQCSCEKEGKSDKKSDINKSFAFGFQLFNFFFTFAFRLVMLKESVVIDKGKIIN